MNLGRNNILQPFSMFLLTFAEVGLLQWLGGAYASGFGGYPDEAAHFVSAIMVHDFLGNLRAMHPANFAQTFYLHYPKVAIGNWPPLFYAALGTWFLPFGVSRFSALAFIAVAAAGTATAIYVTGRKLLTPLAGLFAASLYVALPLVQESSDEVMTEHLVTLLIFLSTLQFAQFAETGKTKDALIFGFLAASAILTRGSAWSLVLIPPLAILFTGRWRLLRSWKLWLSTLPVIALCVPWYVLTRGMSHGAMVGSDPGAPFSFLSQAIVAFPIFTARAVGPFLTGLAAIGLWAMLFVSGTRRSVYWAALAAMALGVLVIHCVIPAALDPRYMVQLLPSILLLSAAGGQWIIGTLPSALRAKVLVEPAMWLIAAVIVVLTVFEIPHKVRNSGYDVAASALMTGTKDLSEPAVLLASDSIGEGSVIAAVAAADRRPHMVVLRGSKILVSEDWLGRDPRDRFETQDALRKLLDAIPVNAVMVDDAIDAQGHRPYHDMIAQLMRTDIDDWRLAGTFDVVRYGKIKAQGVGVFISQPSSASKLPAVTDMGLVATLMQRN